MRNKGHIGLTLLILSPIFLLLNLKDLNALAILILAALFSSLPDIDLRYAWKHRSATHNIFFAIIAGFIIGSVFGVSFNFAGISFLIGFMGAFLGILCHLLGDLLTNMEFKPFAPLLNKKFAFHLFDSKDKRVNEWIFRFGSIAFLAYFFVRTLF